MANFIEVTNKYFHLDGDPDDEVIKEPCLATMFINIDEIVSFWEDRDYLADDGKPTTCLIVRNLKMTLYVYETPLGILNEIRRLQQCNQEMI